MKRWFVSRTGEIGVYLWVWLHRSGIILAGSRIGQVPSKFSSFIQHRSYFSYEWMIPQLPRTFFIIPVCPDIYCESRRIPFKRGAARMQFQQCLKCIASKLLTIIMVTLYLSCLHLSAHLQALSYPRQLEHTLQSHPLSRPRSPPFQPAHRLQVVISLF